MERDPFPWAICVLALTLTFMWFAFHQGWIVSPYDPDTYQQETCP